MNSFASSNTFDNARLENSYDNDTTRNSPWDKKHDLFAHVIVLKYSFISRGQDSVPTRGEDVAVLRDEV